MSHRLALLSCLCLVIVVLSAPGCDTPPATPKSVQRRVTGQFRSLIFTPSTTVETFADIAALETELQNGEETSDNVVLKGAETRQLLTRLAASPFGPSIRKLTLEAIAFDGRESPLMVKLPGVISLGFERCNFVGVTTEQLRRMRPPSVVSLGFGDCTMDVPAAEKFADIFGRLESLWYFGRESQIEPGVVLSLSRSSRRTVQELALGVNVSVQELEQVVTGMPLQVATLQFSGMSDEHFEVLARNRTLARINTAPCNGVSQSLFRSIEERTGIDLNFDHHPECP